jgi:hypothetical protein
MKEPQTSADSLEKRPEQWNADMRFLLWNVRNLHRRVRGSLMTVSRKLSKYKLDSLGVQKVRWEGLDAETAGEYTFSTQRGTSIMNYAQVSLCIRESYYQLRGFRLLVIRRHTYY